MGNGPTFPPASSRFAKLPRRRRREGPASAPPIPAVPTAEAAEELGIEVCAASSGHGGSGGCDRCGACAGCSNDRFPMVEQLPPENSWLEDDPFLFWDGKNFSGRLLNFQKPLFHGFLSYWPTQFGKTENRMLWPPSAWISRLVGNSVPASNPETRFTGLCESWWANEQWMIMFPPKWWANE